MTTLNLIDELIEAKCSEGLREIKELILTPVTMKHITIKQLHPKDGDVLSRIDMFLA